MTSVRAKVAVNFASTDYRLLERLYLLGIAVIALLAVAAGVLVSSFFTYRASIADMEQRLAALAASEEQMRPLLTERERVVRDLTAMAGLMEARRFSWTRLLSEIEDVVPTGVALSRVDLSPKDRSLSLEGAALSPEALRNLMIGMERSAAIKAPLLKHQSVDKGKISFTVGARYEEQKGGGGSRTAVRSGRK